MLRNVFLLWLWLVSLAIASSAFAEKKLFIAPDQFEIEVGGAVPSLRFSQDRFGPAASVTLVPAYHVALTAIGYAYREIPGDVEINRLPVDVENFTLNSRLVAHSPAVRGVELEKGRNRVVVRILFSNDITVEQARLMLSGRRVLGSVKGKITCTEGIPKAICLTEREDVPAFNQFQESDDEEIKIARSKYAVLNQYKAERLARLAGNLAAGADLDRVVRDTLMVDSKLSSLHCRRNLGSYEDWVCRIILEQSSRGSLNEAIFEVAKRVFPDRLIGEEPSRFVFDATGSQVRFHAIGVLAEGTTLKRTELERILATRSNPSMTEPEYRMQLYRYAQNLFYHTADADIEKAVDSLMQIRSLAEDSPMTRALMAVVYRSTEDNLSAKKRIELALAVIQYGRGPALEFDKLIAKRSRLNREDYEAEIRDYLDRYFEHFTPKQRKESAKALLGYSSIASCLPYTQLSLSGLIREVESVVAPPSADPQPRTELDRILRSLRDPGVTEAQVKQKLDSYVQRLRFRGAPEDRRRIAEFLRTLYDDENPLSLDAERRAFRDIFSLIEGIDKEDEE